MNRRIDIRRGVLPKNARIWALLGFVGLFSYSVPLHAEAPANPSSNCPCCDCWDLEDVTLNGKKPGEKVEASPDEEGKITLEITLPESPNDTCDDCESTGLKVRLTDKDGKTNTDDAAPANVNTSEWTSPLTVEVLCLGGGTGSEGVPCLTWEVSWEGCEACESGGEGEDSASSSGTCPVEAENGSVYFKIPVGTSGFGSMKASLSVHLETTINPGRSALILRGWNGITKTSDAGGLLSVTTQSTHAAIANTPTTSDPNAYTITLSYDPSNPSGTQFRTILVESTSSGSFKVSSTYSGVTRVAEWALSGSTWTFTDGNGLKKVVKTVTSVSPWEHSIRRKDYEQDPTNSSAYLLIRDVQTDEQLIAGTWKPVKETIDPDGSGLVSTWSYYGVSEMSGPGSYLGALRLKEFARYDGYSETHNYYPDGSGGSFHTVSRPFGSGLTELETIWWNPSTATLTTESNMNRKRVVIYGTNSVTVRNYVSAGSYLQTVTETYPVGTSGTGGKTKKITNPDGTIATYSYSVIGGDLCTTEDRGAASGASVVEGVRTLTRVNYRGVKEENKVSAISAASGNGVIIHHWVATGFDSLGRATTIEYFPLNSGGAPWTITKYYTCCGLGSESDKYGITTTYAYDTLQRRIKTNRIGVTEATLHAGLTTSQYRYAETPVTGGLLNATPVNEISRTVTNLSRTITESWGASPQTGNLAKLSTETKTFSNPHGSSPVSLGSNLGAKIVTEVIQVADDGSVVPKQSTLIYTSGAKYRTWGDLAPAKQFVDASTYSQWQILEGVSSSGTGGSGREYQRTYPDWLGRSKQVQSASGSSYVYYNTLGQLEYVVDADGVTTRFAYNSKGERTVTALKLNGTTGSISWGTDQIRSTETFVAQRGTVDVIRTQTKVWKDGDTSPTGGTVVSTMDRTPDGLINWTDHIGVANPENTTTALSGGGDWTVTQTQPDGSYVIDSFIDGLLDGAVSYDVSSLQLGSTMVRTASGSRGYDTLNRNTHSKDARTGISVTAYVSAICDQVSSITDPGNRIIAYGYDHRGRQIQVDAPNSLDAGNNTLSNITTTSHYSSGEVKEVSGGQGYHVSYTYDYAGRKKTMTTYGGTTATTTWNYSPTTGRLTSKKDHVNKGPSYTYTDAGRLWTRTWERDVITTTYGYSYGRLNTIDYSDATPDVVYTYDALGREDTITQTNCSLIDYEYDPGTLALDKETVSYDLDADGNWDFTRVLDRSRDPLGRDSGWQLKDGTTVENGVEYRYDDAGRVGEVEGPAGIFTYGYLANSSLIETVTGPQHEVTNTWETTRDALDLKENKVGSTTVSSYDYSVNAIGQRTGVAQSGSAFASSRSVDWGYDFLGQVAKSDSSESGHDRSYLYDAIGNRKKSADSLTLPSSDNYTADALNQYTAVGSLSPTYDDDGNATAYPLPGAPSINATFAWDAENRLVSVTAGTNVSTYLYDALGRRFATAHGGSTLVVVYDGWNPIAQYLTGTAIPSVEKRYTWGLDLSGTLQGAGGAGGLLSVRIDESGWNSYYPLFDGNGNVSEYLDGTGAVDEHFEYDPFGRKVVGGSGHHAISFGTKQEDFATGLFYYGYRWYDPATGRWPSRDPIGEQGGANLYGFVGNNGISSWDYLGREPQPDKGKDNDKRSVKFTDEATAKDGAMGYTVRLQHSGPNVSYPMTNIQIVLTTGSVTYKGGDTQKIAPVWRVDTWPGNQTMDTYQVPPPVAKDGKEICAFKTTHQSMVFGIHIGDMKQLGWFQDKNGSGTLDRVDELPNNYTPTGGVAQADIERFSKFAGVYMFKYSVSWVKPEKGNPTETPSGPEKLESIVMPE